MPEPSIAARRTISRSLLQALARHRQVDTISLGTIVTELGERSFGWSILLFSLVNLIPLPIGSNMVTAIPLLFLTGQMAFGLRHVGLPAFIGQRRVSRNGFRRTIIRLRPLLRPMERIVRPRRLWLFQPRSERIVGVLLLCVSVALFLPIPLSGYIPATALLVTSLGLIERDGTVVVVGMAQGVVAMIVTLSVLVAFLLGASYVL